MEIKDNTLDTWYGPHIAPPPLESLVIIAHVPWDKYLCNLDAYFVILGHYNGMSFESEGAIIDNVKLWKRSLTQSQLKMLVATFGRKEHDK